MRVPSRNPIQVFSLAAQYRLFAQDMAGMLQDHVRCTSIFRGKSTVSLPPDNYTHSSGTFLAHDSSKCVFKLLSLLKPQRPQRQDDRLERGGYMLSSRVLNEPVSEMSRWLTRRRVRWDSFNSIWNGIHAFLLQTRTPYKLSLGILSLRTALQSPLSAPRFSLPSGIPKSISEDLNL